MSKTQIKSMEANQVTRNFKMVKIVDGKKFTSFFTPETGETEYQINHNKSIIRWQKGFAIEWYQDRKQKYTIEGKEYQQLAERYYPAEDILQQAMVDAYLLEMEGCDGVNYFIEKFAEGTLKELGVNSTVVHISAAFLNNLHFNNDTASKNIGLNELEMELWNGIAKLIGHEATVGLGHNKVYIADDHYLFSNPYDVLDKRIKDLLADGYDDVASKLAILGDNMIVAEKKTAANNIWKILFASDPLSYLSPEMCKPSRDAFIDYLRENESDNISHLIKDK